MSDGAGITAKDIYEQQYAHFRGMNDILYKMPPIFSTILGGLWYFAASYVGKDKVIACGVFAFAAIASACFVVALQRFNLAFTGYLNNLNRLDGDYRVTLKNSSWPSTITAMTILVLAAFIVSVVGGFYAAMKQS
jgi:hypothetical protein